MPTRQQNTAESLRPRLQGSESSKTSRGSYLDLELSIFFKRFEFYRVSDPVPLTVIMKYLPLLHLRALNIFGNNAN
jgi:hypothetical protein